ncbi:hypothetical protein A3D84_03290 [Candidatus Woesebacteria bacterium RIFCSPHIGHO2_02_FULL_42_20]|uniref:CarD-like/TRCF RNAP-interacting domain-containing protein n=1 Tax=Candidatus Woesebacteria bacterium RIFCSPHIGHO2_12_FULL_41_24 TaxID=1802510 RepID=A0A1F8ATE5_9BACT|nr:MAG: hypothetical protein A2W15_03480 [Candidatus Woesebacteria bacterium RBG_16_41_13]OGM28925.1 MAG: hypothetical protein A2873_01630 [Candidatus Woesebacteria bacterium RIFCSPHIGHO2_01_FULL_42_80]OGM34866.1 MAG: hypothetical protein A3D84_03290 [Candidatus Woesebacteria bacterium RIFCSPHIGHO2_02_FULL_42_20]OGM54495.1 MAG: hypothetical protein A3E44_00325 [Candidatus Woesebacteria bacterium RIFCSPHIGHO2_12_FULL_41_24]OGM65739.1 MAG: hypothetical protein A2969_00725 [Candidatus Woesebacteri
MSSPGNIKIGSKLVEGGKVYTVYKIEEKTIDGAPRRIICYKPHFSDYTNDTVVCSLPEDNLQEANIRRPISLTELENIIRNLSSGPQREELDVVEAKVTLGGNDIYESVEILKIYWREKNKNEEGFTKAKKDILNLALEKIVEEVALIQKTSLEAARTAITKALS